MTKQSLLFGYLFVLMLAVGIGISVTGYRDRKALAAWEAFKVAQHCQAVSHEAGVPYKVVTYGPKNEVNASMGMTPNRTGWRCDDGVARVVDDGGVPTSAK